MTADDYGDAPPPREFQPPSHRLVPFTDKAEAIDRIPVIEDFPPDLESSMATELGFYCPSCESHFDPYKSTKTINYQGKSAITVEIKDPDHDPFSYDSRIPAAQFVAEQQAEINRVLSESGSKTRIRVPRILALIKDRIPAQELFAPDSPPTRTRGFVQETDNQGGGIRETLFHGDMIYTINLRFKRIANIADQLRGVTSIDQVQKVFDDAIQTLPPITDTADQETRNMLKDRVDSARENIRLQTNLADEFVINHPVVVEKEKELQEQRRIDNTEYAITNIAQKEIERIALGERSSLEDITSSIHQSVTNQPDIEVPESEVLDKIRHIVDQTRKELVQDIAIIEQAPADSRLVLNILERIQTLPEGEEGRVSILTKLRQMQSELQQISSLVGSPAPQNRDEIARAILGGAETTDIPDHELFDRPDNDDSDDPEELEEQRKQKIKLNETRLRVLNDFYIEGSAGVVDRLNRKANSIDDDFSIDVRSSHIDSTNLFYAKLAAERAAREEYLQTHPEYKEAKQRLLAAKLDRQVYSMQHNILYIDLDRQGQKILEDIRGELISHLSKKFPDSTEIDTQQFMEEIFFRFKHKIVDDVVDINGNPATQVSVLSISDMNMRYKEAKDTEPYSEASRLLEAMGVYPAMMMDVPITRDEETGEITLLIDTFGIVNNDRI